MNNQYMAAGSKPAAMDIAPAEYAGPDKHRNREQCEANRIIGAATCQQVIESEILFAPPEKDRAIEVIKTETDLEINELEVRPNTVCIGGCMHKGIIYKTVKAFDDKDKKDKKKDDDKRDDDDEKDKKDCKDEENRKDKKDDKDKENGKDKKDDKDKENGKDKKDDKDEENEKDKPTCTTIKSNPIAVDGVVRHTTAWIPFRCFANVHGAQVGDYCEVVSCDLITEACSTTNIDYDEEDKYKKTDDAVWQPKFIKGVRQKDFIKISVKVKR